MTTPIHNKNDQGKAELLRRQIQYERERQLTSREYLYRDPSFSDVKISIIKALFYGGIAVLLIGGHQWSMTAWLPKIDINTDLGEILVAIVAMCGIMVVDAVFGLAQSSVNPPSYAALLFPIQNADWGLLPLPLIYFAAPFYILYKCVIILFW